MNRRGVLVVGAVVLAWSALGVVQALGRDVGQWAQLREQEAAYGAPDLGAYYRALRQPDAPGSSCCGESDAYFADRVDACDTSRIYEQDPGACAFVAIITDTRPDEPRGRPHVPVGTRIPVPPHKVRKHPVPNPTDHNVIFAGQFEGYWVVHCWEPVSGM
jgi:hypothetical protein